MFAQLYARFPKSDDGTPPMLVGADAQSLERALQGIISDPSLPKNDGRVKKYLEYLYSLLPEKPEQESPLEEMLKEDPDGFDVNLALQRGYRLLRVLDVGNIVQATEISYDGRSTSFNPYDGSKYLYARIWVDNVQEGDWVELIENTDHKKSRFQRDLPTKGVRRWQGVVIDKWEAARSLGLIPLEPGTDYLEKLKEGIRAYTQAIVKLHRLQTEIFHEDYASSLEAYRRITEHPDIPHLFNYRDDASALEEQQTHKELGKAFIREKKRVYHEIKEQKPRIDCGGSHYIII
ncbi:MAG: hypothetical protein ABIH34_01720 [Nanoarchaeota archaeon]